jgi:general secretion pathway protein N
MRRVLPLVIVLLVAFGATLLARLPASWARGALPSGIACGELSGTIWRGRCAALTWSGVPAGDLDWSLRPGRLFAGRLAADLALARGGDRVEGRFEAGPGGVVSIASAVGDLDLGARLLPQMPSGLAGRLRVDIGEAHLVDRSVTALQGRAEVRNLAQRGTALGNHAVVFERPPEPDGRIIGTLRDLGGPLSVEGTLTLTPDAGYLLEGRVGTRPGVDASFERQLGFLGTPDAQGRRPFSLEGTF